MTGVAPQISTDRWSSVQSIGRRLFEVDVRSLAAMRIGVALLILFDIVTRLPFVSELQTDRGLAPRNFVVWDYPPSAASLYMLSGTVGVALLLLGIAAAFGIMLLLGYRTRLATFGSWVLLGSLLLRNTYALDGGDYVLLLLLLWGLFLPLGRRWSLDARNASSGGMPAMVCSVSSAGIMIQVALVYVFGGVLKLAGSEWLNGTAVYWVVADDYWARPLSLWLRHWPLPLIRAASYLVLVVEIVGPFLLFAPFWTRRLRNYAIGIFLAFQLTLALSLQLWMFPAVMTVALFPFVPGTIWNRITSRTRGKREIPRVESRDDERSLRPSSGSLPRRLFTVYVPVLLLTYALVGNIESTRSRSFVPDRVHYVAGALGMVQGWGMYAPTPYQETFRVITSGTDDSGTKIPIDSGGGGTEWAPIARLRSDYRAKMFLERVAHYLHARQSYALWVCSEWPSNPDEARTLQSVTVEVEMTPIRLGGGTDEPRKEVPTIQSCS